MTSLQSTLSTLDAYLESNFPNHRAGLPRIIRSIATASLSIHRDLQNARLSQEWGLTGRRNVQGEIVDHIDEASTASYAEALKEAGCVSAFACEEIPEITTLPYVGDEPFVCVFDPLDGSSNIDVASPVGTIFGIYRQPAGMDGPTACLQAGRDQAAALYIVFGASCQLVLAVDGRVDLFTLDISISDYRLSTPDVKLPDDCPYYSVNEGNFSRWDPEMQSAVESLRNRMSLRYVGTLVADAHRGLLKGGVFLYPGDAKNPDGKLRLVYEANPMAFIIEAAGGAATSGRTRILDIQPTAAHQRIPLVLGNADVVEEITASLSRAAR